MEYEEYEELSCGCRIMAISQGSTVTAIKVEFCRMHAAADRMATALAHINTFCLSGHEPSSILADVKQEARWGLGAERGS